MLYIVHCSNQPSSSDRLTMDPKTHCRNYSTCMESFEQRDSITHSITWTWHLNFATFMPWLELNSWHVKFMCRSNFVIWCIHKSMITGWQSTPLLGHLSSRIGLGRWCIVLINFNVVILWPILYARMAMGVWLGLFSKKHEGSSKSKRRFV